MKTRLLTVFLGILLVCITGCEIEGQFRPSNDQGKEEVNVEVTSLASSKVNSVMPQTVVTAGDYMMLEINDPSGDNLVSYAVFNTKSGDCTLISVTENSMMCVEYDMETKTISDKVLVEAYNDGSILLSECTADWSTGNIEINDVTNLGEADAPPAFVRTKMSDDFASIRRLLSYDMMEYFSKPLSLYGKIVGTIPFLKPASEACSFIAEIVPLTSDIILYSDDPEMMGEQLQKRISGKLISYVINALIPDDIQIMYALIAPKLRDIYGGSTPTNEEIENMTYGFNGYSNSSISMQTEVLPNSKAFTLHTIVSDVTENSAVISGTYKCNDSEGHNIFRKGIRWCESSNNPKDESANTVDQENIKLSNLKEATTYKACSFLTSTSGIFYGEIITFTTKGVRLSLSPNTIDLPVEGGTKGILVETNENAEWVILSKPSWCNIERADYSFFVSVGQNQSIKPRSGTITVQSTVTYEDGTREEPLTATIAVTQEGKEEEPIINGSGFDHTKWNVTSFIAEASLQVSGILEFGDISKGEIYADGMNIFEGYDGEMQIQIESYTNNKLILVFSLDSEGVHWRTTYTLERFNNQLKGIVEGYMKMDPIAGVSYPPVYLSGTMDGTLIK